MQQFFENNWLSILSIFIGVLVSYIFYRLQKKDGDSATLERKKHAISELLDVVESYIINKQCVSEHLIENLVHASERDHKVTLQTSCTPTSLLQDVALRLQRSRHLDIPQKSEYSEKIEELIKEIRDHQDSNYLRNRMSLDVGDTFFNFEALILPDRRDEARRIFLELEKSHETRRELEVAVRTGQNTGRMLAITIILVGLMAALATTFIGSRFFIPANSMTYQSAKSMLTIGLLLATMVAMQVLLPLLRIKRRRRKLPIDGDDSKN